MPRLFMALAILLTVTVSGCTSAGGYEVPRHHTEDVQMVKKNYRVIKAAATGKSSGFLLFGLIPLWSPTYNEAKQNLYASVGVPMEGKAIALANQAEDNTWSYWILFALRKKILTADVVEFTDAPAGP